jgi:hypothetical protein
MGMGMGGVVRPGEMDEDEAFWGDDAPDMDAEEEEEEPEFYDADEEEEGEGEE